MSLLGLCWLCCGLRLARFFLGVEKCAAEVQWPGNTRHRCLWIPRPGHNDRAKIENAAKDALVDLDAFNFMNIDFDCGTANKPKLCYDALVGNVTLGHLNLESFGYKQGTDYYQKRQGQHLKGGACQ